MALWYVATWGGFVNTVIVRVKLFPATGKKKQTNTLLLSKKIPEQVSRKANSSFLVELEHPARH